MAFFLSVFLFASFFVMVTKIRISSDVLRLFTWEGLDKNGETRGEAAGIKAVHSISTWRWMMWTKRKRKTFKNLKPTASLGE